MAKILFRLPSSNILAPVALLLLTCSCSNYYRHLEPAAAEKTAQAGIFTAQTEGLAYDTNVRFRKTEVSGILFIQPQDSSRYRMAMTTKMGQKIFDFTLTPQHFTVNYCFPQLNRKIVLQLLEADLRLLTEYFDSLSAASAFTDTRSRQTVFRIKKGKSYLYFRYDNTGEQPAGLESGSKRRPKILADLKDYEGALPHRIKLEHRMIFPLRLDLSWVSLNDE
ncbi:MAG: hypothetical protein JNK77_20280 [Saprospiraceae bacterium]|nr:hypothetical protein [Saprospiraceae bacterium]